MLHTEDPITIVKKNMLSFCVRPCPHYQYLIHHFQPMLILISWLIFFFWLRDFFSLFLSYLLISINKKRHEYTQHGTRFSSYSQHSLTHPAYCEWISRGVAENAKTTLRRKGKFWGIKSTSSQTNGTTNRNVCSRATKHLSTPVTFIYNSNALWLVLPLLLLLFYS